jgi:perosamine synthetase
VKLSMSAPDITEADVQAVSSVVRSGHLSIGPQLETLERVVARRVGVPHAIGVNSGTSALHLAVIAAGVSDGGCVVTTPFSFVASANCVLYERATPVFVDVDPATGNIATDLVAERADDLSRAGRLSALLPVHTFGQPAEMDALNAVARAHGVPVIEDACEAIGAEYNGRPAGALGDVAAFAFYPNKQMTTGEGGVLVTRRADWDALFRSLRNQGRDVFDAWLNHSRLGYNYRLDEMSAALGVTQLARLDDLLARRARVAAWYTSRLALHEDLVSPPRVAATTTRMSWFVYVVRLAPDIDRDRLMRELDEQGIPSRPYFMPIHLQKFYRERFGHKPGDFPVAEDLGRRSLALPFSGVMTEDQVDYVCRHVVELVKRQPSLLES